MADYHGPHHRGDPPPKYRYRGLSLPLLSFSSFYTKDLNINKEYIHCNYIAWTTMAMGMLWVCFVRQWYLKLVNK